MQLLLQFQNDIPAVCFCRYPYGANRTVKQVDAENGSRLPRARHCMWGSNTDTPICLYLVSPGGLGTFAFSAPYKCTHNSRQGFETTMVNGGRGVSARDLIYCLFLTWCTLVVWIFCFMLKPLYVPRRTLSFSARFGLTVHSWWDVGWYDDMIYNKDNKHHHHI